MGACSSASLVCQEPFNDFLLVVASLQSQMEASFCKVLSSCRTVGGSGRRMIETEDGKIGHSCSLSFPNAPSLLQALQPALPEPTFSAIPLPQLPHTRTTRSLLSPRPHVSCVYFLDAWGKGEKRNSAFHRTHASQGKGERRRRRKDGIKCSSEQRRLQCWEAVSPRGSTTFYINLVQLKPKVYFAHENVAFKSFFYKVEMPARKSNTIIQLNPEWKCISSLLFGYFSFSCSIEKMLKWKKCLSYNF